MNYGILIGILNLILLSRLRLVLRDKGINRTDMWILSVVPLLGLAFLRINVSWFVLAFYLILQAPLMFLLERSTKVLNRNRIVVMMLHVFVIGLLCSPLFTLSANLFASNLWEGIGEILLPGVDISTTAFVMVQWYIFGFLLVLNEANVVLRYLLKLAGLKSLGKTEEINQREYNTGRVIGMLERIFVFLFVLLNQYAAIGFILAAKGVTRFKDFESRTFAEYVLIGTLLSALLAMAVGFIVKLAIGV